MGAGELPPEPTSSDSGFTVMPTESMSSLFGTPPKASPGQGDDPMDDFPGIDTNGGPPSVHQSPVPFHSNVASVANDGPTFSDTSPTRPDQPTPRMDSQSISKSPLRDSTGSFDNPLFVEGSGAADGIENTAVRETDETDADTSVSHANPLFEDERDTTAVEDVIANIEEGVFRVDSPMTTPQLIGGTPLLDLSQYSLNPKVKIMAKCEYLNPSGSIKDRIAQHIIAQAESSGQLKPGMTVVAATSGNTGAAIAMASALRGYDYIVITNKKTSKEKIDAMKAYGGEVQVSPSGVAPDHPDHYQNIENRLVAENPGTYYGVDQYNNPYNTEAYEVTLGPEIWHQTSGEVTHFIAGGSTGGTVSGTGRYLKSQNDKVRVVMADPHGSVFWDHIVNEVPADDVKVSKSWEMEGVGKDSIPGAFDINVIDGIVRGNDEDAFAMCREVAANDGLLLGGSAGLNLHAARVLSGEVEDGAVIVTVFPDNGVKYLSKIFNDSWLESKGLQGAAEGNGAVSEDVATKPPMESTVTWKSESWNPEPPAPTAALDETHMTLETDSAPPTPIAAPTPSPESEPPVKVANDSEGLAAELRAELDGYRVAAGEMAAEISEKDEKIASLEKELKAAAAKFKAHDSKVRAEERDRVSARLDKAEGALEKERRVAEEAKASQAQMQTRMTQMESSTAGTDALKARVETLEAAVAEAKAAETVAVEQAAALKGTVDDMEKKLAEAARSKAEAEAAKVEEPAPVQTEESADADARVAAAEKVCEKLMADNQELVTRVNAQAVELDRLRGEFKDVDIAPTLQEMNGDAAPHVEEWEQRRGRGIWGFISGADRFVPPPPKEPEEQTQNAQPEE